MNPYDLHNFPEIRWWKTKISEFEDLDKENRIKFIEDNYQFKIGSVVYALNSQGYYARAVVTSIENAIYTVQFDNGATLNTAAENLLIYFPCNCNSEFASKLGFNAATDTIIANDPEVLTDCYLVNKFLGTNSVFNIIYFIRYLLPIQFQNFLSNYIT